MKIFKIDIEESTRYIIAGTLSASVNLMVFFVLKDLVNINYLLSNIIAWTATAVVAYYSDKIFVFKTPFDKPSKIFKEFSKFFSGRLFSLFVDMSLLWFLVDILRINSDISKLLNSTVVVSINYMVCKLLVFKTEH